MTMTSEVQKPLSESPRLRGDFREEEEEEEIDVVDGTDSIVGSAETPGTKHYIKSFYFRKKKSKVQNLLFWEKNPFN